MTNSARRSEITRQHWTARQAPWAGLQHPQLLCRARLPAQVRPTPKRLAAHTPVGRHLQSVLKERDGPADEDGLDNGPGLELEVQVPCHLQGKAELKIKTPGRAGMPLSNNHSNACQQLHSTQLDTRAGRTRPILTFMKVLLPRRRSTAPTPCTALLTMAAASGSRAASAPAECAASCVGQESTAPGVSQSATGQCVCACLRGFQR